MLRRMLGITLDKNTVRDIALYLAAAYEERQQRASRTIKDIIGAAPFVERLYIEIAALPAAQRMQLEAAVRERMKTASDDEQPQLEQMLEYAAPKTNNPHAR